MDLKESRHLFAQLVSQPDEQIDLARAALLYAFDEYPALEVDRYLRRLDFMAESAAKRIASDTAPTTAVHLLNGFLFDEEGFAGNRGDYYDPRNSYLNEVLDRKVGIPITLSVVYLELGWRLGLPIAGVGMPGHFLVKYEDEELELYIDPFNGGMLMTEDDCAERLRDVSPQVDFHPQFLAPSTNRQILTRMLYNLKHIYFYQEDWRRALRVVDRVLLINPLSAEDVRDMGVLWALLENYERAVAYFDTYLRLAPHAPDVRPVRESLRRLRQAMENEEGSWGHEFMGS